MKLNKYFKTTTCFLAALLCLTSQIASADKVGSVSTKFNLLTPNDKIVIKRFTDPDVPGVACFVSMAEKGGMSGAVGLASDTSDASIACRQVGPILLPENIANKKNDGDRVFKKRSSILFKTLQVVRFYDPETNSLVYLTYSDKLVDGSPKNAVTAVPVMPWPEKS